MDEIERLAAVVADEQTARRVIDVLSERFGWNAQGYGRADVDDYLEADRAPLTDDEWHRICGHFGDAVSPSWEDAGAGRYALERFYDDLADILAALDIPTQREG